MRRGLRSWGWRWQYHSAALAQTGWSARKRPRRAKTATAARRHTSANPTAIIDTTAGKMTCTLFPDKAPIGVANFIGLASGTKDWKNPMSGATKHMACLCMMEPFFIG